MSDGKANLTLKQRRRMQESAAFVSAATDASANAPMNRRRKWAIALAAFAILLAGGSAWAWIHFHPGLDPRLQELADLQAKLSKLDNPFGPEGMDLIRQMREKGRDLPDDLKAKARDGGRAMFEARMDQFFAKSSKDQLAELDQFIAGMQLMEAMQKMKESFGGSNSAAGGQKPDGTTADSANQSSGNQPGNNQPHGPWGRSDAQRAAGFQKMLSDSNPFRRAEWGLGRQMMQARMQQQNVTPPSGGFF